MNNEALSKRAEFSLMRHRSVVAIFILSLFAIEGSAQIEKGSFRVGTAFSYNEAKTEDPNLPGAKRFDFGFNFGTYLSRNFEVGILFEINRRNGVFSGVFQRQVRHYLGPQITYMLPISHELYLPFFVSGGLHNITHFTEKQEFDWSAGFGLEYLVAKQLGLRFLMAYGDYTYQYTVYYPESSVNGTSRILKLAIGFNFYFNQYQSK